MALNIELVLAGRPVDGMSTGWREIERAIELGSVQVPSLERIDPYSQELVISGSALRDLISDCQVLEAATTAHVPGTLTTTSRLRVLAETASSEGGELRFLGD